MRHHETLAGMRAEKAVSSHGTRLENDAPSFYMVSSHKGRSAGKYQDGGSPDFTSMGPNQKLGCKGPSCHVRGGRVSPEG